MARRNFVVGYSKAPEQPQDSARPICHSQAMTRTGREPATIRIAAYNRSLPSYALRHGRRQKDEGNTALTQLYAYCFTVTQGEYICYILMRIHKDSRSSFVCICVQTVS